MRYKAILFDFDGVLSDTLEDNFDAWQHAFSQRDLILNREQYFALEGMKSPKIAEELLKSLNAPLELGAELLAEKDRYYAAHNEFAYYDGVEELVEQLASSSILCGVVSGGSAKRIRNPPSSRLLGIFKVIITGDDCVACKPSPDPYLSAAAKLGAAPEECVVIENAPLGIESAKNAGMYCVALRSTLPTEYLLHADQILDSVSDVTTHILPDLA